MIGSTLNICMRRPLRIRQLPCSQKPLPSRRHILLLSAKQAPSVIRSAHIHGGTSRSTLGCGVCTYPGALPRIWNLSFGDDAMPVTITGMVFDDRNHNGVWDSGEPGISNVYLTLFNAASGACVQTFRDASGVYSFSVAACRFFTFQWSPCTEPLCYSGTDHCRRHHQRAKLQPRYCRRSSEVHHSHGTVCQHPHGVV